MWMNLILGLRTSCLTRLYSSAASVGSTTVKSVGKKAAGVEGSEVAAKDIILFRYENPRFFQFLNIFAITQCLFWGAVAASSLTMVDTSVKKDEQILSREAQEEMTVAASTTESKTDDDLPFWRKINLGADKYKYGLCVSSALMGYGMIFGSWTYIMRSVRYLILRKDMKAVSFVTYGPFGKNRIMEVPIDCISAAGSRNSGTSQMPVKVKGRSLYYILDLKDGKFPQPKLFDQTVGLQRNFK